MRILRQRIEEAPEVFVQQRVARDVRAEAFELLTRRQLAVHQQPRHLEERALLRELFNRIAAIAQDALLAIDEGDRALARTRVAITRIERDQAGGRTQLADVGCGFVLRANNDGQVERLAFVGQDRIGLRGGARLGRHNRNFRAWGLALPQPARGLVRAAAIGRNRITEGRSGIKGCNGTNAASGQVMRACARAWRAPRRNAPRCGAPPSHARCWRPVRTKPPPWRWP